MIHLKNDRFTPSDSRELIYKARNYCIDMDASVRVARVSSKFVEFDVEVKKEELDLMVEKLSPIGKLDNARHIVEENIEKEIGVKDGIFYFNNDSGNVMRP